MSCSLVLMGGLIWIDNSWALFPDNDPATSFESSILFKITTGELDCDDLDPDGDGQIPLAGGKLMKGNGDQDDNKPEPLRIVYRLGAIIPANRPSVPLKRWDCQAVRSYLDFGHLKVFPDASVFLIISEKYNDEAKKAVAYYLRGSLLLFNLHGSA